MNCSNVYVEWRVTETDNFRFGAAPPRDYDARRMNSSEVKIWKQPEAHLGVNDPDLASWLIVALYLITAALALRTAFLIRRQTDNAFPLFWSLIAVGTLLLGLNKQLDIQTWLLRTGRRMAEAEHLYKYRLVIHITFFLIVVAVAGLLAARWWNKIKSFSRRFQLATAGCGLIATYVLVRAMNINHIDQLFGVDWEDLIALWLLEVGGLTMLLIEMYWLRRTDNKQTDVGKT